MFSPPMYGADIEGSLFKKNIPWNLGKLKSILSEGLTGTPIKGVTLPYIYVGCWKSLFGWHKEDMDLYAINYIHYGADKQWYSIDLCSNKKFGKKF